MNPQSGSTSRDSTDSTLHPAALQLGLGYPVLVARGLLGDLYELVRTYAPNHRYAFIADATVERLHGVRARAGFPTDRTLSLTVASGEVSKSRREWERLSDALLTWGAGRDTTIVAVGGGVPGDLAGFVAATLHRGVPVVQVPTTLLAMVDSAVGGKTGVDTPAGKNLVGAFHDPRLVVADVDTLRTLPPSVLADGLAEMIKHGVIADADVFAELCGWLPEITAPGGGELPQLRGLIARSVAIKAQVVAADAREAGLREILNAGHTIAHAIEQLRQYTVPHGSAVAAGLVVEAYLAEELQLAAPGLGDAVADAVRRAGLPDVPPDDVRDEALLAATRRDKKARAGSVRYALPSRIGTMHREPDSDRWSVAVDDAAVRSALVRTRQTARHRSW